MVTLFFSACSLLKCFKVRELKCSKEENCSLFYSGCKPLNDHKKVLSICGGIFMLFLFGVFLPFAMYLDLWSRCL